MKNQKLRFVLLLITLVGLLFLSLRFAEATPTRKKYGKNIIYYDFSKIPDNLVLNRKIELPKDLKEYLEDKWHNPRIEDFLHFEQEVWEEADKLGYTPDNLKNVSAKEAIRAAVEIVVSRFTPHGIDEDEGFIKEYGKHLSIDAYFHLKLGDCDKYRDATMAIFNIIKRLNPQLQNVYLSSEELGGSAPFHTWVSILIPQDNYLILSQIDPIFYDNGKPLEASGFHICLEHNIFIAEFYRGLSEYKNEMYAFRVLEQELLRAESREWQEKILKEMSFTASLISYSKSKAGLERLLEIARVSETYGFTDVLSDTLFWLYQKYLELGKQRKAEDYKQRLLKEFPDSFWTKEILSHQVENQKTKKPLP